MYDVTALIDSTVSPPSSEHIQMYVMTVFLAEGEDVEKTLVGRHSHLLDQIRSIDSMTDIVKKTWRVCSHVRTEKSSSAQP